MQVLRHFPARLTMSIWIRPYYLTLSGSLKSGQGVWQASRNLLLGARVGKDEQGVIPNFVQGMGSNGLTSARHDVFHHELAGKYPESFDPQTPNDLVYSGRLGLTEPVPDVPVDAGKLVLSATRTYAPIVQKFLEGHRANVHGMVHCSGGAQTKVLHFLGENLHVVKDNMMEVPVLFRTIQEQSATPWEEMYKVFNMGHRMEVYADESTAQALIEISQAFGVHAQVIGRVESKEGASQVTVKGPEGTYSYT